MSRIYFDLTRSFMRIIDSLVIVAFKECLLDVSHTTLQCLEPSSLLLVMVLLLLLQQQRKFRRCGKILAHCQQNINS